LKRFLFFLRSVVCVYFFTRPEDWYTKSKTRFSYFFFALSLG